jgi:hypothetical protein
MSERDTSTTAELRRNAVAALAMLVTVALGAWLLMAWLH